MSEPREWKAIAKDGSEWYVRDREPTKDELALGYARGVDGGNNILVQKGVMKDIRESHFYIIGAHGTGKSKFMERLIAQDLQNENGFGVIDPHSDLFEEVKSMLALSVPDVESRVVVIDPTDPEYSVCFNPLELPDGVKASEQAEQLVLAFKKLYGESWGQRLEAILRNVLMLLIENGLTLREFTLVMRDNALRKRLLRNVKNQTCREYFEYDFDRWNERTKIEWTQSTTNKIDAFLSDERLARIFSSTKSSFDLWDIIENGKILIVKLNHGRLGTGGEILGSLLLTKLQLASMARDDQDHDERRPFYLYIDEFQNFATDSFLDIINETRKYKLALTFAHQNLEQLSRGLRASVPNCGLQGYFRMNRPDAERLAKESLTGVSGLPETWEERFVILQNLESGVYVCKNKSIGGAAVLQVLLPTRTSRKILKEDGDEEAHRRYKSMGADYLRRHEDIDNEYQARRATLTGNRELESFREKETATNYGEMIKGGENDRVEFKASLRWGYKDKPPEYIIAKAVSSFMNAEGGMLFIGVRDDCVILGIENDYPILWHKNKDGFLLQLTKIINEYLGKEFHQYTAIKIFSIEGKDVCAVDISSSKMPAFLKHAGKEEFFIRASATSQPMNMREANEYIKSHFLRSI